MTGATMSAWFDCSSGASGDMLLGALLGAGASVAAVQRAVDAVVPGSVTIRVEKVVRGGLAATKVHVDTVPSPPHRTWHEIRGMLAAAALPDPVRERAQSVFGRLARAEAEVHGTAVDDVHFHEVGALDAIGDVVGACAAYHDLGISAATATPLVLGGGRTRSAHGELPVPVPAVLRLLAEHLAPASSGGFPYEMTTPTGAALVLSLCSGWGDMPALRLLGGGVGAGTRDLPNIPNVVRVVLGTADGDTSPGVNAVMINANVDDLDPRIWPHVLARLMAAGAFDAWLTPILMKKGRPAHTLSVLCPEGLAPAVRQLIITETSTIGTREYRVGKRELEREFVTVELGGTAVRIKVARHDGRIVNAQPEYDDVVSVAESLGIPVKVALTRSIAAAEGITGKSEV